MSRLSRRSFLAGSAGIAALSRLPLGAQNSATRAPRLRVQFTTGGHFVPLQQYEMFDDPLFQDLQSWIRPHPHPFGELNGPNGPDVLVLGDYVNSAWPEEDRPHVQTFLDAGKGLVVLHHSVGDNQTWPWWYQQVLGGALIQRDVPGMPRAGMKQFPRQHITPVGKHPIVRDIQPFTMPPDELYYKMWFAPKIQVLLRSDDPVLADVNGTIAWLGVHPRARVVCFESGHTDFVNADPRFRKIVHNMILWAGGKLS
jgi:type 1 glutamine amidotransferase